MDRKKECKRKEGKKRSTEGGIKKAMREKKAASARNVSCHCVKYQEGRRGRGMDRGRRRREGRGCEREAGGLCETSVGLIEGKEILTMM